MIYSEQAPIYVSTCSQNVTALSPAASEDMAHEETTQISKWLRKVLIELNIQQQSTVVSQDNRGITNSTKGRRHDINQGGNI